MDAADARSTGMLCGGFMISTSSTGMGTGRLLVGLVELAGRILKFSVTIMNGKDDHVE